VAKCGEVLFSDRATLCRSADRRVGQQASREDGLTDGVVKLAGQARAFFEDSALLFGPDLGRNVLHHRQQDLVTFENELAHVQVRIKGAPIVAQ
jgi:hypothetical protein